MESWGSPLEAEAGRTFLRKKAEMKRSEMCRHEKIIPGKGKSRCKGPEAGYLEECQEGSVAGAEKQRGRGRSEKSGGGVVAGLRGHGKDLGLAHMTWDVMMYLEQRSGTLCLFKNVSFFLYLATLGP